MSSMTKVATHKASKEHSCSWCGEKIESQYNRYRYFSGGEASTIKMHPECYDAMIELSSQNGGWIEWTTGEYERPNK